MGDLSKNMRYLRDYLGMSQADFGQLFDCNRDNIMSYERGTEPKLKTLQAIANYFHTTIDTLYNVELNSHCTITRDEKENVYLKCIPNSIPISKSKELGIQNVSNEADNGTNVAMLDLKVAAATFGAGYLPSDNIETLGTLTLPPLLAKKGRQYVCLPIDGDSMQPSLSRGDYVIAYLIDPSEHIDIVNDRVYVISTLHDGIVIKRVKNRLRELNLLRLKSDNKEHRSYNLPASEIVSILEVVFKIDFNLSNKAKSLQDQIHSIEDRLEELQALLKRKP